MANNTALTPIEVAELLKISKNTVYELIKRGELNSYRVGKKVRVDLDDVEEYKNRTKNNRMKNEVINEVSVENAQVNNPLYYKNPPTNQGFVICGQDIILDILSRHLQNHPNGTLALRSYIGSYEGLYSLYHGKVHIATAHLWDGETGQYNTPYVKRLLPGTPAVIINLATRLQGFYVKKGNPKNIKSFEDLKREDITFINREKGSGTRILLDEYLKKLKIDSTNLKGYNRECFSHLLVASAVVRGSADVGLGNEKNGLQVSGIDFIPLHKERYEMVIKKEDLNKPHFRAVIEIINSEEFKLELEGIGGYDLSELGKIVAET
ncbi:helix-turn-helix transcriptional regulator [Clostridium sp. 'White wine YQ']|uniref:helix-turn-helix transcriptional regulator n=1 Tax=Clostridium sp. 'White wine YQ' TaxID=3027474 RepID=UPI0023651A3C|nr:helix-turn-helix transcriptional regulator [Clostridium sp. 'White wine YQ']MDD7794817.1 helix-turn-helix transcriptional regulator [Clostridium sp. 'White wine YQ']